LLPPARRCESCSQCVFDQSELASSVEVRHHETATVRLDGVPDPLSEVRRIGQMPTPPYIRERLADRERYQTVFAREEGSAAAPTAGLHFTPGLLKAIRDRGVNLAFVTLHVGLDTFQPVRLDDPSQHTIHREWFRIDKATANAVNDTLRRGNAYGAWRHTCVRTFDS